MYLVTIWTLKVSCHLCFAIPRRTRWIPLYYVFHYDQTNISLSMHYCSLSIILLLFMCNIVAKFSFVQIKFIMPLLKCFDLSLQCFYIMVDQVVLASCHLKNYLVITYLLEDEQELSLEMLIRPKRIYNFLWSMLVLYPMPKCFLHVFTCFLCFPDVFIH